MKTGMTHRALLLAVLVALTAGTGCLDLSNKKRVVRRQVMTLQAYLSQGAFAKAATMYTDDFVWLAHDAQTATPGASKPGASKPGASKPGASKPGAKPDPKAKPKPAATSAAAFHESIQQIPSRTSLFIHQERLQELGENEVLVLGSFQVRAADSTSLGNTQWEYSMTWVRVGETWKVKEIKERSARRHAKS